MKLENQRLSVEIDAAHGGRITSFFDKELKKEFLWYDASRLPVNPALDYDGNFAGGMDELLPNDPPENGFPDHGELWTASLKEERSGELLTVSGFLPCSKLFYRREMHLEDNALISRYCITNTAETRLDFLWKCHAAWRIEPGDRLFAQAHCVQAADPGDWSLAAAGMPKQWQNPYVIGAMNGKSDFFFLTDLQRSELLLKKSDGSSVKCIFDSAIFPNAWIFISFGRLNGSRTLIMEPCTNYPLTIAEAKKARVCAHLDPQQTLTTQVRWESGRICD